MRLTTFTDYSLRTLMYLAVNSDRLCTTKEVSDYFQVSQNHMVKVAHSLCKMGYVDTQKGKNGGMKLAKSAKDINIGEAIRKLEPDFHLAECFNCNGNTCKIVIVCKLKTALFNAYKAFFHELDAYTLADVTENKDDLLEMFRDRH